MDDLTEIDELEQMTNDFLDALEAAPETIEMMRSLWQLHFEMERRQRREMH